MLRFFRRLLNDFVARPASPRPLAVLRIGLAAVLLAQAYALAGNLIELYGNLGIVQWGIEPLGGRAADAARAAAAPVRRLRQLGGSQGPGRAVVGRRGGVAVGDAARLRPVRHGLAGAGAVAGAAGLLGDAADRGRLSAAGLAAA